MPVDINAPSARKAELLEASYRYVLEHGLADLSLRPLATAIGSSPRVLLYLFGNKEGLIHALLRRARDEEMAALSRFTSAGPSRPVMADAAAEIWKWLSAHHNRPLLILWAQAYARSLTESDGPLAHFAKDTVRDWLGVLSSYQPADIVDTDVGGTARTLTLTVLRGALLDLLATGDSARIDAAVQTQLALIRTLT